MLSTTQVEDKKFATVFPESVKVCAEAVGVSDLAEDIAQILAEDATYRLREVVSKSCLFMRQGRRKKLKSADVDKAFFWSNVSPALGHSSDLDFIKVEDVVACQDTEVDLQKIAQKNFSQPKVKPLRLSSEWRLEKNLTQPTEGNTSEDTAILSIPEDFNNYYSTLVKCLLSDNDALLNIIVKDLAVNARIATILPSLVNFVSSTNSVSHDLDKLSWMLYTIKALVKNKHVSLDLYLTPLLKSVMYCVLEPLAASINPLNDHWVLRDCGARLLSELIYSHSCHTNSLLDHVRRTVAQILADTTRPLCSHYGAARTLGNLHCDVTEQLLLPGLRGYVTGFLHPIMTDSSLAGMPMKEDAYKVAGAVADCIGRLFRSVDVSHVVRIDVGCTELFGTSLIPRVPPPPHLAGSASISEKPASLFPPLPPAMPFSLRVGGLNVLPSRFGKQSKRALAVSDIFDAEKAVVRQDSKIIIKYGHAQATKRGRITKNVVYPMGYEDDLRRTPETAPSNPRGSIEPRLRTTKVKHFFVLAEIYGENQVTVLLVPGFRRGDVKYAQAEKCLKTGFRLSTKIQHAGFPRDC